MPQTNHLHRATSAPQRSARAENRPAQGRRMAHDAWQYLREYAQEKPEVAAVWCLAIGFVLGWKLKPW